MLTPSLPPALLKLLLTWLSELLLAWLSELDRSIKEGVGDQLGGQTRHFLEGKKIEKPQNWRKPWRFFCRSPWKEAAVAASGAVAR